MAIAASREFPGIGFDYDPGQQPFFKAMVKESLRKLNTLATGKMLLTAIRDARPGYRSAFPKNVNVVIKPPFEKKMLAPGIGTASGGLVLRDNKAFADWDSRSHGALIPGGPPNAGGGMVATLNAKTLAEASEGTKTRCTEVQDDGKPGIGCTCFLKFSNIEIVSKSGQWLPDYITMGHELIHCWHMLNGSSKRDIKAEEWMTVGIKGFEGMAVTENKLRQDASFPLRTKYFPDD